MKKLYFVVLFSVGLCLNLFGQHILGSITSNGKVYYYKPSSTPSSPQPRVSGSGFIANGRWYGVEAAKAWATLEDWAYEQCEYAGRIPESNEMWIEHIMSVEAKREPWESLVKRGNNKIVIKYWMVRQKDSPGYPGGAGYSSSTVTFLFK